MAYDSSKLNLLAYGPGSAPSKWTYVTTDAHTDVDAADYFSDGYDKGLKVNDVVEVIDTSTPTVTLHPVTAVTTGGAATIGVATLA